MGDRHVSSAHTPWLPLWVTLALSLGLGIDRFGSGRSSNSCTGTTYRAMKAR
jgi:hypothetical protein